MTNRIEVDCCIAGGGPAGIMAGLLFARAGCQTLVVEKHADFLRDFRGDTVHPSTLQVMHELSLLDEFLTRPHQRLSSLSGNFSGKIMKITDFSKLDSKCRFIAFMPQWHFLDFLCGAARSLPTFAIRMETECTDLVIGADGRVAGLRAQSAADGAVEIRSRLVIGADGRNSRVREVAKLRVEDIGAPIDVLWFRVPRDSSERDEPLFNTGRGHIIITIDRGDYYQCAFVIPKGGFDKIRAGGLENFRQAVARTVPRLARHVDAIGSFDELSLLTVKVDRLQTWSRPGLLMIGDAAHAMSPIGGVGINLAIQDAVAAANLFADELAQNSLDDDDLPRLRGRRLWPTRVTQAIQVAAQSRIIAPLLRETDSDPGAPMPFPVVARVPFLQRLFARFVGIGVRAEHVASGQMYRLSPEYVSNPTADAWSRTGR